MHQQVKINTLSCSSKLLMEVQIRLAQVVVYFMVMAQHLETLLLEHQVQHRQQYE